MSTQTDQGDNVQSVQGDNSTDAQAPEEKAGVTVGGKSYSSLEDMAKDYESLTQEFHKRNQSNKADVEEATGVKDVEALVNALEEAGFAKKQDIDAYKKAQHLDRLVQSNPELSGKKDAIEVLQAQHPDMAVEDVIEKYGLAKKDKLTLARSSGDVMGDAPAHRKSTVEDDFAQVKAGKMSLADFKAKHSIGQKGTGLKKTKKL